MNIPAPKIVFKLINIADNKLILLFDCFFIFIFLSLWLYFFEYSINVFENELFFYNNVSVLNRKEKGMRKQIMIFLGIALFSTFSLNCLTNNQERLLMMIDREDRAAKIISHIKRIEAMESQKSRSFKRFTFDVNFGDKHGNTPLHLAARRNSTILVDFLLKKGANVAAQNVLGVTPLHEVVLETGRELEKIDRALSPEFKKFLKTSCKKIIILLLKDGSKALAEVLSYGDMSMLQRAALMISKEASGYLADFLGNYLFSGEVSGDDEVGEEEGIDDGRGEGSGDAGDVGEEESGVEVVI